MPRFGLSDDDETDTYSNHREEEDEIEPPHPIGFGSSSSIPSDPASPWGKSWISLDPPSRSAYNKSGRSTYALDDDEDLFVQSYPPISSYLRSDQISTTTLIQSGAYRDNGDDTDDDDDDLYYSEDEEHKSNYSDNDELDEMALLFRSPLKESSHNNRLVSALQEALTPPPNALQQLQRVELEIQKRVEAERQRIDAECSRTASILEELVLQTNKEAEAVLQKQKAEQDRLRKIQNEQEEHERKIREQEEQALAAQKELHAKEAALKEEAAQKVQEAKETKQAELQQARLEKEAKAKKATEHIDKAKKLVGQLVQLRASVEPFDKNKAVGKRRLGMKKIAKGKVNTLTENADKIREVATEISQAIARYDQEDAQIKQQLQQRASGITPDMAVGRRYFVDLLASTAMTRVQAESFQGTKGDGFPLAAMLAMVSTESKHIIAVLAAHIYTVCPTAIPTLPTPKADATEDEIMTGIGMQRNAKTGEFETYPQFLARTENIVAFMAAIQSSLPSSHPLMGGNNGGILWLKRFLDLLPAETKPLPLITAPVLGAFLNAAGHMLANAHGENFQKLLHTIQTDIVNRLDEGEIGKPSAIRLSKILEGGFEGFLVKLPSKAIPELYCGASERSTKQNREVISFGGTIGGQEDVKERSLPPPSSKPQNPFGAQKSFGSSGGNNPFGQSSNTNSFGGGGGNNPFGQSSNTNSFGGGGGSGGGQSGFGNGGNNNAANASPFGGGGDGMASSPSPFGGGSNNASNPQPFGGGGMAPAPSPFGGGGMAPSPSPFGSAAAPSPSPFGGGGMTPTPSPFGAAPSPSPFGGGGMAASPSPFGGGAAPSPSPFGGGGMAPSPSPFGGGATPAPPPFGGGNNAFGSSFGGGNNNNNSNPSPFGGGGMQQNSPFGGGGQNNKKKKGPCRFFQQGRCRKGDNCEYSHESGGKNKNAGGFGGNQSGGFGGNQGGGFGGGNNNNSNGFGGNSQGGGFGGRGGFGSNNNNSQGGKKGPCRFFAQGRCRKGNDCPFSHETGGGGSGGGFGGGGGGFGSSNGNPFGGPRR